MRQFSTEESPISDEVLCTMAASGDPSAEEELVVRYRRLVRACARPFFLAGGDSEDLIQEGMIGLVKAVREYDPARYVSFRSYAAVCIRNRILTAIRTAARDKQQPLNLALSLDDEDYKWGSEPSLSQDGPEDILIGREALREQMDAIRSRLSPFEGEVLDLYLSGLSYAEIASELRRPEKSVDNAVQRIRSKLGGT